MTTHGGTSVFVSVTCLRRFCTCPVIKSGPSRVTTLHLPFVLTNAGESKLANLHTLKQAFQLAPILASSSDLFVKFLRKQCP